MLRIHHFTIYVSSTQRLAVKLFKSSILSRFLTIISSYPGNLEVLSNAITPTISSSPSTDGYKLENQQGVQQNLSNPSIPNVPPVLNINDLFQKLVASGFVTTSQPQTQPSISQSKKKEKEEASTDNSQQIQTPPTKTRRSVFDYLKSITFEKPETLKVRQSALYGGLYSGMQCSSCGMRFSPEASMQYSQHLDWHFRQNRKGKRNIRVAASRRWYYSLADWKNYEELEDLEERGNTIHNNIYFLIM